MDVPFCSPFAVVVVVAAAVAAAAAAAACNPSVTTTAMQPFLQQVPTPSETRDRGKRLFYEIKTKSTRNKNAN